jgi:alcohol dehydrogenase class IV
VLPYALEFNAQNPVVAARLNELARSIGRNGSSGFIAAVKELNRALSIPAGLEQTGVKRSAFDNGFTGLVANCLKGSTRVNPVPVTAAQMAEVLKRVYAGL